MAKIHFKKVCENCGVKIGGCDCKIKKTVIAQGLCEKCYDKFEKQNAARVSG